MQNLRDQLLQAGAITKEQKQRTEQEKRRQRKQHNKAQLDNATQAQRRQAYEAKLAAQRNADRERAAAQQAERDAKETSLQIRHLIEYWKVPEDPTGARRWYFATRSNTIRYLYVSEPLAARLETGALAIVEHPEAPETPYVLVDREAAVQLGRIDPQYVCFHNTVPPSASDP